jgi:hypothetical protein
VLVASHIRGRKPNLLENLLGYRPGRLSEGWYLLFLLDQISANDFELHGYTHFSGGRAKGSALTAKEALRTQGVDVERIKRRQATERFKTHGPDRIAKVVPVIEHSGIETYPPGHGIPQWRLTSAKRFRVKALIGPGQAYLGDYLD